jgi:DNA repair protein RadA/Sms
MSAAVIHIARCRDCQSPMMAGMKQCRNPKCRAWNVSRPIQLDDSTVLLSEVKSSKVRRIPTGLVDAVFGSGIACTSVNLLAGEPGAGKTTLSLMLCNIVIAHYQRTREALYIANEQAAEEIAETAERLQLENRDKIRIVKAMGGVTHDIGDLLIHYKPCFTILDSITKWAGEDMSLAVVIAQRIKDYAVKLECPCIIVNQVTKDGDHAGLKQLEHAVDMAAMFDILVDSLDENGEPIPPKLSPRRLWSSKNRFGVAPEEQIYMMTETGLVLVDS